MIRKTLRSLPTVGALGLSLAVTPLAAGKAAANENGTALPRAQATTTTASLNLLSRPRENTPVVRVRQMGNGSWICSPAGFGQRSRCYRG